MNRKAQFNVIEAIISVGIVFAAIYLVSSMVGGPVIRTASSTGQLKILAEDILRSLDKKNESVPERYHQSLLVKYIAERDIDHLVDAIDRSLPAISDFNIYLYNASNHSTVLLYPDKAVFPTGDVIKANRIIVYGSYIYEVELEVWTI